MGTTFSTIQIKNSQQVEPEQFKKLFCRFIEKKGLFPATKEDAQFSYRLAFSDDCSWVTLSSTEYDVGMDSVELEAKKLAKAMKTYCIVTTIFDSDILLLKLFGATAKQTDRIAIGHPDVINEAFGFDSAKANGKMECWIPLLTEDNTWEHLKEIWSGTYVFVEEALSLMAPLLGMDLKNVSADYRYWEEIEPNNLRVLALYFKTAQPMFIKEGATKLNFGITAILVSGIENYAAFYNIGGISKGLSIIFLGECFNNREVEISNIKIKRNKNPEADLNVERDFEIFTTQPKEYTTSDGRHGLIADVDDYVFYEGVNTEHPSMKGSKGRDIAWMYESDIWFTATIVSGDKHDFDLFVIPQSNWVEGQVGCNMKLYKTDEQLQNDLFIR